ncbi:MAG: Rid family detoxifying hydrolase [Bacteroides sp.]|nr:Rid family detoxifying hydrolase [Eubacterium sp.]MCM1417476.1 Rid family detoxifying hydrolase [Roseburia sp.]MCM1461656.1 Rid family detoxifying hydrolase [Bacteroides sp.]
MEKIYTQKAPEAVGPYSQAIVHGGLVYTSGQIAIDPASGAVEASDIVGQTEQIMKNLGEVLRAAGASFDTAIKTTCFLVDMNDFAVFNGVYEKYFTSKPARSCVAVKALPKNVLAEVEVIAAVEAK